MKPTYRYMQNNLCNILTFMLSSYVTAKLSSYVIVVVSVRVIHNYL